MSLARPTSNKLPQVLRAVRTRRGLTQEDFGVVSSRTYMSGLERGRKSPTVGKLEQLASVMNVHPLSLFALAYAESMDPASVNAVLELAKAEITRLGVVG